MLTIMCEKGHITRNIYLAGELKTLHTKWRCKKVNDDNSVCNLPMMRDDVNGWSMFGDRKYEIRQ